jgi:hypothetical protein
VTDTAHSSSERVLANRDQSALGKRGSAKLPREHHLTAALRAFQISLRESANAGDSEFHDAGRSVIGQRQIMDHRTEIDVLIQTAVDCPKLRYALRAQLSELCMALGHHLVSWPKAAIERNGPKDLAARAHIFGKCCAFFDWAEAVLAHD